MLGDRGLSFTRTVGFLLPHFLQKYKTKFVKNEAIEKKLKEKKKNKRLPKGV